MERNNKTSIGDINQFAFLKPDPAATKVTAAPITGVKSAKIITKPEINTKFDWY